MDSVQNKVVFITGGGSGIGLALGRQLAERKAKVMLADLDLQRLDQAKKLLSEQGLIVETTYCDVANSESVKEAALETVDRFGKVHILVNNAGVTLAGKPGEIPFKDWRWIDDINLMGVVYGVEIFVPLIQSHAEGGHIINTASMAGHLAAPAMSPYNATKFAVVGYSETIKQDLEKDNIGVSVLCPAWVRTDIHNTGRNKPSVSFGNSGDKLGQQDDAASGLWKQVATAIENGLDPNLVAEWTIESILENRFYIFTHPEMREMMAQRFHLLDTEFSTLEQDERFLKKD